MDIEPYFTLYKDDVYRLALSYTKSTADAEDVSQSVFLKLLEQRSITSGKERAWLMQVTANQCRSLLRSAWWKKTAPLEECTLAAPEKDNTVLTALLTIPPKYRVVLYLHYYECCSTREIGQLLHTTQSAVTTRLSRGREMLRELLKEATV